MKTSTSVIITLTLTVFAGCAALQYGEPPSKQDPQPPSNYKPLFVKRLTPLSMRKSPTEGMEVNAMDVSNPNRVKIYLNVVDSAQQAILQGGGDAAMKKLWCKVVEEIEGKERTIKNVTIREVKETDPLPLAIALVSDHSGSMGDERAFVVQDAIDYFAGIKRAEDEVALVRYDNKTNIECELTSSSSVVKQFNLKNGLEGYSGGTAILNGIDAGMDALARAKPGFRKVVIVFTDGQDNSSTVQRQDLIARARKENVTIVGVDFGEGINPGYMEGVARLSGGPYYHIYGRGEFDDLFEDIYRRLRNYYILEYPVVDYGEHLVKIKVCLDKDSLTSSVRYDNTPDVGAIALIQVQFDLNKADIQAVSVDALANVASMMKKIPSLRIELRGHTDNQNKTSDLLHNTKLSQKRAEAVKDALVKRGVDAGRIQARGFGESVPVADNSTEEGRALNRRTEFVVISR